MNDHEVDKQIVRRRWDEDQQAFLWAAIRVLLTLAAVIAFVSYFLPLAG